MKTTVDIPDVLLRRLRKRAVDEGTTLREVLCAAISRFLDSGGAGKGGKPFRLQDGSVSGKGIAPGLREGDWDQISALAYEGRGG